MIITVKTVEVKDKDGTEYRRIQDTDGKWYSVWDTALFKHLKADAAADIETKKQGDFTNITAAKPASAGTPAAKGSGGGYYQDSPEKRASIERQTCLNAAVALAPNVIGDPDSVTVLQIARYFYHWVSTGQLPTVPVGAQPKRYPSEESDEQLPATTKAKGNVIPSNEDRQQWVDGLKALKMSEKAAFELLKVGTISQLLFKGYTVESALAELEGIPPPEGEQEGMV